MQKLTELTAMYKEKSAEKDSDYALNYICNQLLNVVNQLTQDFPKNSILSTFFDVNKSWEKFASANKQSQDGFIIWLYFNTPELVDFLSQNNRFAKVFKSLKATIPAS
jgi:hypothetical protein